MGALWGLLFPRRGGEDVVLFFGAPRRVTGGGGGGFWAGFARFPGTRETATLGHGVEIEGDNYLVPRDVPAVGTGEARRRASKRRAGVPKFLRVCSDPGLATQEATRSSSLMAEVATMRELAWTQAAGKI